MSKRMLERYSHIRTHAKRAAIEALERESILEIGGEGAQNWAQSVAVKPELLS